MIQVENLHKSFGKVKALTSVSFTAQNGQITGLLGPKWRRQNNLLAYSLYVITPRPGLGKNRWL